MNTWLLLLLSLSLAGSFRLQPQQQWHQATTSVHSTLDSSGYKTLDERVSYSENSLFGNNGQDIVWEAMRRDAQKGKKN
jgi:hypothetical protein